MTRSVFAFGLLALVCSGCATYRWTCRVPEELRTVAVPVLMNHTKDSELGPIIAQYTLREFQREGTFQIRRTGDAALEVQAEVMKASHGLAAYDRVYGSRANEYRYYVTVQVALVNKKTGKVLFEGRQYTGETTFLAIGGDALTGRRNAAFRVANELGRQIVDDVLSYPYNKPAAKKAAQ